MSITGLDLDERLCRICGDWTQFDTTTNITTNDNIISTSLKNYDYAQDDYFKNWWVYIEEGNNLGADRLVYDYTSSSGNLAVRGASLSAETAAVTCRITRTRWDDRKAAINDALREISNEFFQLLDDRTLVTNNILPNPSFEDWTATTIPDFYTASGTATVAETTTAYQHRQGASGAKLTAGAASDYFYISSINYERLLDLEGHTVDLKVWCYPEVANDGFITIYTLKADGTEQTLTSTTSCPAAKWTLLELENQAINDDIIRIDIRFGVTTNTKYAYFDDARLVGKTVYEYMLPLDFQSGSVDSVEIQTTGGWDDACDSLGKDVGFERKFGWDIIDDGSYRYLRFRQPLCSNNRIRLIGHKPFSVLTSGASTLAISDAQANVLLEYAAYLLLSRLSGPMSSDDSTKYYEQAQIHLSNWSKLSPRLRTKLPPKQINVTPL